MIDLIGLLGGALFAAGCLPMAVKTFIYGRDLGTPLSTQWLLFTALIFYSLYLFLSFGMQLPFWFMVVELASWGAALWYHYFPRKRTKGRWMLGYCTRRYGHQGACNGWQRKDCGTVPCPHYPVQAREDGGWMCRLCGEDLDPPPSCFTPKESA